MSANRILHPATKELEEKMSTFRTVKDPENPFVMMDKRPVNDETISWGAKGLLAYLLSKPNDWTIILTDLVKRSTDGRYAVRNLVNELVESRC